MSNATFTVESLKNDSDVQDMAADLRISMTEYGDPITTWFNEDGSPHQWFIEAANDEFSLRSGNTVTGTAVAEALHALITEDE